MRSKPFSTVLLRLRWIQLRRAFPAYGMVLLGVSVLAAVWLLRRALVHDSSWAPHVVGGALFTVWGLHQRRADHHFLQRHLVRPQEAMAVEYGVLLLPVLWGLLLANAWTWAAAWPLVLLVPWSPVVRVGEVRGGWLRKWIPAQLFEWKGLLQGSHPWSVLLWAAALALCWLPVLPLFLLGVLALMVAGAQEHCEPRAMLLATAADARTLLRTKVLGSVRLLLLVELPVLLAATVFQPQWWWVHALFGLGQLALVAYAVVLKYANYRPNTRLEANGANVAVAALFAILPGLSVVPLIMLLTEVPKARANLNAYFHDHHR
jgi:hypothetical protein